MRAILLCTRYGTHGTSEMLVHVDGRPAFLELGDGMGTMAAMGAAFTPDELVAWAQYNEHVVLTAHPELLELARAGAAPVAFVLWALRRESQGGPLRDDVTLEEAVETLSRLRAA